MLRDICIGMVALLSLVSGAQYVSQVRRHLIEPALSTWIIFSIGTTLSFVTYMVAEDQDIATGVLNFMDLLMTSTILVSILIWRGHLVKFGLFEKWYLRGIGLIIIYGFAFGDAWGSNVFVQILIGLGYIPTAQKLVSRKCNTEPFTSWIISGLAGVFGLVPAVMSGNALAVIYALRTVLCVSTFLGMMAYYQFIYPRKKARLAAT